MERIPTPRWDTNRLRLLLTACMILLLVGAGTIAIAQSQDTFEDDFEDETTGELPGGWETTNSNAEVKETAINGTKSLYTLTSIVDGTDSVEWVGGPNVAMTEEFEIRAVMRQDRISGSTTTLHNRFGIINDPDNPDVNAVLLFNEPENKTILSSDAQVDAATQSTGQNNTIGNAFNNQWIEVRMWSMGDGTLNANVWEYGTTEPNGPMLQENFEGVNGNISINVGSGDSNDRQIWLDDITVDAFEFTEPELDLRLNHYMKHGTTQYYSVIDTENGVDVSAVANVTSSNTTVLTVNEGNQSLTATNNTSINQIVTVTAEYQNDTVEENVTVASATMDNWAILPSFTRIEAMFSFSPGDDVETNMVWIILAVLVGMAFTTIASSFAGIGVTTLIVIIGWFWGQAGGVSTVGTGVMLAALFGGLFIGLNLAANIDYAMTRGGGGVEG